jgi:SAM-dependent methyltransferase
MIDRLVRSLRLRGARGSVAPAGRFVRSELRRGVRAVQERAFDVRHGVVTRGIVPHHGDAYGHAVHYQGTPPGTFRRLLGAVPVEPSRFTFIDLGCGKGKALLMAKRAGFEDVLGVELSPELAAAAEANVQGRGIAVRCGDAACIELPHGPAVVYLFNPFDAVVMAAVLENVRRSVAEHPRALFLVYQEPAQRHVLDRAPWLRPVVDAGDGVVYRAGPP